MTPRLATRNQTSFRVTWPRPLMPVDGYQVALIPLVSWGRGQGWGQVPSASVAPVWWPQCGPDMAFIPIMRCHLWPPTAAPLGDTIRVSLWCPQHVPNVPVVPRASQWSGHLLLPNLGMGTSPHNVPCPQDEP